MKNLKVALITGSSSGIGRAAAHLFASKGFSVAVHGSKSQEKVDKVVNECNKLSINNDQEFKGFVANFNDSNNAALLVENVVKYFGRLDTIVCNAGIDNQIDTSSQNWYSEYKLHQSINVDSHVELLLQSIPVLMKAENASIVIITSVTDQPIVGAFAYHILYYALRSLAKSLAIDLAPKIRVNSISLGPIYTPPYEKMGISEQDYLDHFTLKRYGKPDEVAHNIWHLSQEATYTTGADLKVDGGLTICNDEIKA